MSKFNHLMLSERQDIHKMRGLGKSIRQIARLLNRDPSTISRELKRSLPNYRKHHYSPLERARLHHEDALKKRSKPRKGYRKLNNKFLLELVIMYLVEHRFTPIQIEYYFKRNFPELSISAKSIYNYINEHRKDLKKYLIYKGKKRRSNICGRRSKFREGVEVKRSIHDRDPGISSREEFGHWEIDTVHGKKSGSKDAVLTLIERKTRKEFFLKLKDLTAELTRRKLVGFIKSLPKGVVKTITADNGAENALWFEVEKVCEGVKFYFCDPYKSQQKGAVERANKDLRVFYPKGTDWEDVATSSLEFHTRIINNRPKECLNWSCANEVFDFELTKVA